MSCVYIEMSQCLGVYREKTYLNQFGHMQRRSALPISFLSLQYYTRLRTPLYPFITSDCKRLYSWSKYRNMVLTLDSVFDAKFKDFILLRIDAKCPIKGEPICFRTFGEILRFELYCPAVIDRYDYIRVLSYFKRIRWSKSGGNPTNCTYVLQSRSRQELTGRQL